MPGGGRLAIETANVTVEPGIAAVRHEIRPGRYVELLVTDTGVGMTPETVARIFEPFYTTKPEGKGTGLGLATCHGIVAQNGGKIAVFSELGVGSAFHIFLPCVDAAPDVPEIEHEPQATRGTETVLIVEDDEMVRRLAVVGLRAYGYSVLEAADGPEALALARTRRIDLVVSDFVMPGMSGLELRSRLGDLLPAAALILASGHSETAMLQQSLLRSRGPASEDGAAATAGGPPPAQDRIEFLSKPFTPAQLARMVRHVLDTRAAHL